MGKQSYTLQEQYQFLHTYLSFLESGYNERLILDFLVVNKMIKADDGKKIETALLYGGNLTEIVQLLRFHSEVQAYINHGEQIGNLHSSLRLALLWLEDNIKVKKALQQALTYPTVLIGMSLLSFIFVSWFLFPQMEAFLGGYQVSEKPFVFGMLEIVMAIAGIVFGVGIVGIMILLSVRLLSPQKQLAVYMRIPVVNYYLRYLLQIQLANRLNLYLSNGYSCLTAFLHIMNNMQKSLLYVQVSRLDSLLQAGYPIGEAFQFSGYYSDDFLLVINFAIQNNTIGKECGLYSERAKEMLIARVVKKLKLLQAIMTCLIALFLVLTYIAVFMPMLSVFETL